MSCRKITAALKRKGYQVHDIDYNPCIEWGGYSLSIDEESESKALEIDPNVVIEDQFDNLEDALCWVDQLPNLKQINK